MACRCYSHLKFVFRFRVVRLGEPHPLPGREHVRPGLIQALDCLPALTQIQVIMVAMARMLGFDPDRAFGQSKITHTV